jgi:hypothetical protein
LEVGSDLSALLRAARRQEIDRRGEVTSADGSPTHPVYDYHIHGAGYSFRELRSGKAIHFDVHLREQDGSREEKVNSPGKQRE